MKNKIVKDNFLYLLNISSSAPVQFCFPSIVLILQDILPCNMDDTRHSDFLVCHMLPLLPFVPLTNNILFQSFLNSFQLCFFENSEPLIMSQKLHTISIPQYFNELLRATQIITCQNSLCFIILQHSFVSYF